MSSERNVPGGFADLAMPVPLDGAFTYSIPDGMALAPGVLVRAPWGSRRLTGVVVGLRDMAPDGVRIRAVDSVIEGEGRLEPALLELVRWTASYYQAPLGEVMRCALAPGAAQKSARRKHRAPQAPVASSLPPRPRVERLNSSQQRALAVIEDEQDRRPVLLHGVTGSGKTAVYLAAIEAALARGESALLLVPEIGLTPAVFADFTAAFAGQVAVLHSGLGTAERARHWRSLAAGEARVAIGTRSAVFAPLPRLGLILVDEEHDASYKQQEAPRYHGRDLAVLRAKLAAARCVLGSATPSLESFRHARSGKYRLVEMAERVERRPLPVVKIVDMGEDFRQRSRRASPQREETIFSQELLAALAERLERRQQSLLLLNRRGFAPVVLCRSCGASVQCRDCSLALTFHKRRAQLVCHFCGWSCEVPASCPGCGSEYVYFLGSGSEKVEEELVRRFPLARVARLDRDTVRSRRHFEEVLARFRAAELDILVGTQMIAKGHDVPGVTLVGVLQADLGLNFPDFRAAERTFQLLTQVAGRAGRGQEPGEVLLQAQHAAHYAVEAAARGDFAGFIEKESNFRRWMHYPPFAALAAVHVRHRDEGKAQAMAREVRGYFEAHANASPATRVLGPAPAPLARAKREYRLQFLCKSGSRRELAGLLRGLRAFGREQKFGATALLVDVDPLGL